MELINFWVISPNVEQDASVEKIWKNVILKEKIAIMGWDTDNNIGSRFVNEVKKGDVILISQGANNNKRLFLCGQVREKPAKGKLEGMPSTKYFCYLDAAVNSSELNTLNLDFTGTAYGDASRIPALYILKPWENAADQMVCEKMFNAIQKKKMENIINKCILSEDNKVGINKLWNNFRNRYNPIDQEKLQKEADRLIVDFKIYLDKIKNNSFELDDYTNRKANNTDLPGSYLCNFLERTTRHMFGSSKPAGSALSFGIKADVEDHSFTINGRDPQNHNKNNREDAEKAFGQFKFFFSELTVQEDIFLQMHTVENCSLIWAKQILRKFLVLLHPFQFIYIYNEKIDDLYEFFFGEDNNLSKIEKSFHINPVIKSILGLEGRPDSLSEQIMISRFLWELANSQSIFSKANPNVILYGPPGTGKTYQVRQNLEFLTKGDTSRIRYVIFHPSYGYEDFIEGIKACGVTENGSMKFELINGSFKDFCKQAKERPKEDFYYVVDEINRANLSAVFGETLVCLERSYRDNPNHRMLVTTQHAGYQKHLPDEKKKDLAYEVSSEGEVLFGVPDNIYFIGMMNNVDKSIDSFDLALRRRFKWLYMGCDYEVLENLKNIKGEEYDNIEDFIVICKALNEYISDAQHLSLGKSFEFGHALYMQITTIERRKSIFQKSIDQLFTEFLKPTLVEYLRAYYDESEIETKIKEAQVRFQLK